ncbi:YheT family hydrolase [Roseivirga sp.]|uniref:YheT family hydrolase n=1 Tax=Roseivirga sp. TaxID=1964215 RepID=UPI003B520030
MPIVESRYKGPPFYYFNQHIETIVPSLLRKIDGVEYQREQIDTPDGDFLNVDRITKGHPRLLVISHGLEGGSDRHYVTALAKMFSKAGWDIAAWNNRTCNGEMNRTIKLYHHAASYDLRAVVDHALSDGNYEEVCLVGISMGGGQTLRYLGQHPEFPLPEQIKKAVAISAPCSLPESAETLYEKSNRLYEQRFLKKLVVKIKAKAAQFPEIDVEGIDDITSLRDFDNRYSGPLNGFDDAAGFYEFCNPYPFMSKIDRPTLVINALNDPLLKGQCYPTEMAEQNKHIYLEMPKRGGHVGFTLRGSEFTYSEKRTFEFLNNSLEEFKRL